MSTKARYPFNLRLINVYVIAFYDKHANTIAGFLSVKTSSTCSDWKLYTCKDINFICDLKKNW